ncbi:AIG2 family protein [Beutenbergia cavernae DSM 12333]|uniref:AIG2 family protein n=1 Tax=Beutenbergia cavernae (strain ATCC BAA-8 / DSM 12333 / CCUG 43141 / JCM 11478 / NBRC 16432 / NCIMB 13614 / HKI 0122) TaxID=471853 RepID=C5C087_BEUC1|nr:gamma-glutamylcyclotransferase family protein [Beutenbergia cavernae]ACQ79273.1 AIG2 family protein [Beutenbergia cavernae DSM 12333]
MPHASAVPAPEPVFSYGTLRDPAVQLATFGRTLDGCEDAVVGFRLGRLRITDPAVVAVSGAAVHPVLVATGDDADRVAGTVLELTASELEAADAYESADYRRISAPLAGGGHAWVYLARS